MDEASQMTSYSTRLVMTLDGISLKELFQYIIVIQQNVCVAVICMTDDVDNLPDVLLS